MTGSDASVRTSPRLNPFAFPSETTLRFALLVILALCGSSGQYGVLWDMVHRQEERLADACVANASTTTAVVLDFSNPPLITSQNGMMVRMAASTKPVT